MACTGSTARRSWPGWRPPGARPDHGTAPPEYAEDDRQGVGRRNRRVLAADYVRRDTAEILDPVGTAPIMITLPPAGTAALLCVERDPEACHRSLTAERLIEEHGVAVDHLRPD